MFKRSPATTDRPRQRRWMFAAGLAIFCCTVAASDTAPEKAQLALLVRQLDQLGRTAAEAQRLSDGNQSRYHFDYVRLQADLARVRGGIEDYLSPPRAQPRDSDELSGQYREPADAP